MKDFNSATVGGEWLVGLSDLFDAGLGIGFYQNTAGAYQPLHAIEHPGKRRGAVMHDTPQIEDEAVVLRRKRTHAVDQAKGHVTNLSREIALLRSQ